MKKQRYYNVEGGKVLLLLYIVGLLLGTLLFYIATQGTGGYPTDYFDFAEYIKSIREMQVRQYFSYILMIRIKQALLFVLFLFIFTPYILYCILVCLLSFFVGIFFSSLVWMDSYLGIAKGLLFFLPHGIFYGLAFVILYRYLFQKIPSVMYYRFLVKNRDIFSGQHSAFLSQLFLVLRILALFLIGCYTEAYWNPVLLMQIGSKL